MPETPEDHPPVALPRRLAAAFYDALIVFALIFIAAFLILQLFGAPLGQTGKTVLQVSAALIAYGYFVGFWTHGGQTIGMRAWRILVVNERQQQPLTWLQATQRFFAALLSWGCLGLGFLWSLWEEHHRTWHDRLSRTVLTRR